MSNAFDTMFTFDVNDERIFGVLWIFRKNNMLIYRIVDTVYGKPKKIDIFVSKKDFSSNVNEKDIYVKLNKYGFSYKQYEILFNYILKREINCHGL